MFAVITHDFTRGQLSVPLFISGDRADQHCSSPSAGDGGLIASPEIQGDEGLNHPQTNLWMSRAEQGKASTRTLYVPLRAPSALLFQAQEESWSCFNFGLFYTGE